MTDPDRNRAKGSLLVADLIGDGEVVWEGEIGQVGRLPVYPDRVSTVSPRSERVHLLYQGQFDTLVSVKAEKSLVCGTEPRFREVRP